MNKPASNSRKSMGDELRVKTLRRLTTNFQPENVSFVDDESERSFHRKSVAEASNRSFSSANESFRFNGEKEVQDHLQMCTKMHAENKIDIKTAWKLRIFDALKELSKMDASVALKIAGGSLEIGAKVYGMKVDDVYKEGMKLASNLARMDDKEGQNSANGEVDLLDEDGQVVQKKEKKKRRNRTKAYLAKDSKSLLAPLPKLDPVTFSVKTDPSEGLVECLLTNKLCPDEFGSKFMPPFSKNCKKEFSTIADSVDLLTLRDFDFKKFPQKIIPICGTFRNFDLNESEEIEKQDSLNDIVVFDEQGIPMHQLDEPLNDHPGFFQDDGDGDESHQVEENFQLQMMRQNVERVTDLLYPEPLDNFSKRSEYSYNSVIRLDNGKLVEKIWAGPSHWKLKCIQRDKPRLLTTSSNSGVKRVKSKKEYLGCTAEDFIGAAEKMQATIVDKKKKKQTTTEDTVTLPPTDGFIKEFSESLRNMGSLTIPGFTFSTKKFIDNDETVQNHDSCYGADDGCDVHDDDLNYPPDFTVNNEFSLMAQRNFMDENLVDVPQYVPQVQISYASHAKRMDMKKLKTFTWNIITANWATENPTKFSKVHEELKRVLPEQMRKDLSSSLALYAMLQLANENTLLLENLPKNDFTICEAISK